MECTRVPPHQGSARHTTSGGLAAHVMFLTAGAAYKLPPF